MLEFIFFHHNICKLFTDFITGLGIEYQVEDDEVLDWYPLLELREIEAVEEIENGEN